MIDAAIALIGLEVLVAAVALAFVGAGVLKNTLIVNYEYKNILENGHFQF